MSGGKIKPYSRCNEISWKISGVQTNNRKTQLYAIVLVQRNMRKNMKAGGFRLTAILYYSLNQCIPSNNPLKIQINLPRNEL